MRPKETTVSPTVLSIGYESYREPGALVAALRAAGVERLVDVRQLPLSRRRGFSKTALSEALRGAGIAYEHERALGNPKPYRDLYKSGDVAGGRQRYEAHLRSGSAWAVDWLAATIDGARTCVLCVEHDHAVCHRAVIIEELRDRLPDLVVHHL